MWEVETSLGETLRRKIEAKIMESTSESIWSCVSSYQRIFSIPKHLVTWSLAPVSSILEKFRGNESSTSSTFTHSSSPPLQNLSISTNTDPLVIIEQIKPPEEALESRCYFLGFFSGMLDNLLSYYPVTLTIGEEKKDMFSISLVLTCAVVSCCITLLVNFLMTTRNNDSLHKSRCRNKRGQEEEGEEGQRHRHAREEEDHGDFPVRQFESLSATSTSTSNNNSSSGRSRSNMTMSSLKSNNYTKHNCYDCNRANFRKNVPLIDENTWDNNDNMVNPHQSNNNDDNINNKHNCSPTEKLSIQTVTLNQFPRGNFSPCFEMHGMTIETLLRLSKIPHVVNCVCEYTGPSITVEEDDSDPISGECSTEIWGLQSIFDFLKIRYPEHISKFLTPPEFEIQAQFINVFLENRVCWLLYHWRWFYGINCRIQKFAWSKIPKAYIDLAASSWNRSFGDIPIDCLVDEILKSFNILSQLLGDKDFFIHDSLCEVDIKIFSVLSQALYAMPTTTIEGLIKGKPNLVKFCQRIRFSAWPDWQDQLNLSASNSTNTEGGGDFDKTNSFDNLSSMNQTNTNYSEMTLQPPHLIEQEHHHHSVEDVLQESIVPKSRTRIRKNSTIPFCCPPEIRTPNNNNFDQLNNFKKKDICKEYQLIGPDVWEDNTNADIQVGTSVLEIPRKFHLGAEYNNKVASEQVLSTKSEESQTESANGDRSNKYEMVGTSKSDVNRGITDITMSNAEITLIELDLSKENVRDSPPSNNNVYLDYVNSSAEEKNNTVINNNNFGEEQSFFNGLPEPRRSEGILEITRPELKDTFFDITTENNSNNTNDIHNSTNNNLAQGDQLNTNKINTNKNNDNNIHSLTVPKKKVGVNKSKIPIARSVRK